MRTVGTVNLRVLAAMTLGTVVATLGALFLGEYEFDETLPIVAGPLLGLIVAEIVVSIGHHRSAVLAAVVGVLVGVAVVLAGHRDANGIEPVKGGAYLSAGMAAVVAAARTMPWGREGEVSR